MSQLGDDELLAPGVVEAVVARPWPVVGAALAGVLLAVGVTMFVVPERYSASAMVIIADPQQAAFTSGGSLTADFERYLASAAGFAESAAVLEPAAESLGGIQSSALDAAVTVTANVADRALKITATGPSGRAAADRANATAESFDTAHGDHLAAQADQTIEALDTQIEDVQAEVDSARSKIAANPEDIGAQSDLEQSSALLSTLRERRVEFTVNTTSYGSGVEFVDSATVPSSPASPNRRLNVAVGLLAGVLAGAAFVWFRADRIRPLQSSDEPRRLLNIPLLGKVPQMRSGSGPLTNPNSMPSEDYQFVASALRATLGGRGRVVLVGGVGSGVGTTVTASNLAVAAARDDLTVAVVDGCSDEGIADLFDRPRMQPGLLDLVADSEDGIDRQRLTWALGPVPVDGRSVRFLAYGTSGRTAAINALRSGSTGAIIDELRCRFDVVLVDCGSVLHSPTAGAIAPAADALVLVIGNGTESDQVVEAGERLAVERVPIVGYVYTYADPSERRRIRSMSHDLARTQPVVRGRHEGVGEPAHALPPLRDTVDVDDPVDVDEDDPVDVDDPVGSSPYIAVHENREEVTHDGPDAPEVAAAAVSTEGDEHGAPDRVATPAPSEESQARTDDGDPASVSTTDASYANSDPARYAVEGEVVDSDGEGGAVDAGHTIHGVDEYVGEGDAVDDAADDEIRVEGERTVVDGPDDAIDTVTTEPDEDAEGDEETVPWGGLVPTDDARFWPMSTAGVGPDEN